MLGPADNPIEHATDDLLGRDKVAQSIADNLRLVDASRGYVYGILGPWGSGKSSLINLVKERLSQSPSVEVLDFNPWMFSGAEQLVESFFNELAGQLRLKGDKFTAIADSLDSYSQLLTPLAGVPWLGPWVVRARGVSGYLKRVSDARKGTIYTRRAELEKHLNTLDAPIVVVVDDIDRLSVSEIREIFKLVRLTASFPNVIYLLAFDRYRVEEALTDNGVAGRDYLEKILQTPVDIPRPPDRLLWTTAQTLIDQAVEDSGAQIRFDQSRWPDIFVEIIWPLIKNIRDLRRFGGSIDASLRELQDEVEGVDLLALEAVRVFMPDTFQEIYNCRKILTATRARLTAVPATDGGDEHAIARLLSVAEREGHRSVAQAVIERLFPSAARHVGGNAYGAEWKNGWMRHRRVAHEDILNRFLERLAGEGMEAFAAAEGLYANFNDPDALKAALDALEPSAIQDAIASLEVYQDEYPPESVPPTIVILLNKLPDIPERERGFLSFGDARMTVIRVVLRMLRRLDSGNVLPTIQAALPQIDTLASRLDLIMLVGHREGAGSKLIPEDDAQLLETELGSQVASASPNELAHERELLRLLSCSINFGADVPALLHAWNNLALVASIVRSARNFRRSQIMGNRAVHRTAVLHWDILVKVFGSEAALIEAIEQTRPIALDDRDFGSILSLADRYVSGWRPSEF